MSDRASESTLASKPPETVIQTRGRRLARSIGTSLLGRMAAALAPLITTPVSFGYLGTERYGLWMAVTAVTSMAVFADLGLGNSLMTRLPRLLANDDFDGAKRDVSTAHLSLGAMAVLLAGLLAA